MKQNLALRKIRSGEPAFSFSVGAGSVVIAELVAHAGFDWVWIDAQHGCWGDAELLGALQVIFPTEVTPIVRPGSNDFWRIGRVLDAGAMGVVVPMVNSVEQARQAVAAAKYPPEGERSSGGPRLALFGDDYFDRANEETLVAVQIETVAALEAADEIAAVEGVDCLFVGPSDLRASMQVPRGGAEHQAAISQIRDAAVNAGIAPGIACVSVEEALVYAEQGFTLISATSESMAVRVALASMQQALGR